MGIKAKILWLVAAIIMAVLSLYPLMLSVGKIEAPHKEKSWMGEAALMFKDIFSFQGSEQYVFWLLIGLLIAAFMLKVITGNAKLQATRKLQVAGKMTHLFLEGENQGVALLPRLLGIPRQLQHASVPELMVAGTLAGMMNTQGGYLFIGVDKDGSCTGLEEDYKALAKEGRDEFEKHLLQVVGNILDPNCCALLKVSFHVVAGKDICRIRVKRASFPVYVHMAERSHFYSREGMCTRELEIAEALKYFEKMS